MKFATKLSLGCIALLSCALGAAGLLLTGQSFSGSLASTRTALQAQQEKEKAETDAEKRRVEAQATADADLIAANAEAEKSKVAADAELYVAEKKADANRALNDSLNSNLLEYYKITNVDSLWNGELPTYVGDGNSIPIINGIN